MRDDLMVQQQVSSVWQHMVGVICLNQTSRHQVKRVLPELFEYCSTPECLLKTGPVLLKAILKPLGMVNVREKRIRQMSKDFLTWDGNDATKLYGIGKYGSDSYRLFYKNEIPENVGDHELKRYINEELKGSNK
jgi:methyl-CpG-binding domain protein 4